jgi:putative peptide zinc metalloprotease protein
LKSRATLNAAGLATWTERQKDVAMRDDAADQRLAAAQRIVEQLAEIHATDAEKGRLRLTADFDGQWRDVDATLRAGAWVGNRAPIGVLVADQPWLVDAYVDERSVAYMTFGAAARFYPEASNVVLAAKVVEIDSSRVAQLAYPMLDSRYGGTIATHPGDKPGMPVASLFRVRLELDAAPLPERETRGTVHIDGQTLSWGREALKSAMAVLIRESGF